MRARHTSRSHRPLLRFLGRRLGALVLLLIGITLISFVLTQAVPGDPAIANLGQHPTPESIRAFNEKYGLDDPLPVQYLTYLGNLVQGDLGVSQQTHQPVADDLSVAIPATAELAIFAIVFSTIFGVAFGVLAALRRDTAVDHGLRVFTLAGISVPMFWLGLLGLYLFFFKWGILPGGGRLDPTTTPPTDITGLNTVDALLDGNLSTFWDALKHLILPGLVLVTYSVSLISRYTRSAVLEVLHADYVRAARAKGLPERTVVTRYILRAALPSIVTVMGLVFANVLAGAVLVENIFNWPGIGQYAYKSAVSLDLPAIMGVSIFIALVYVIVNLVVDLLYAVIDPRVRLS
ncbi:ABC transporter permease [Conexibacter sp. CPCC 206217]|uniref:ABC transporter permease n=1 Tax=Conexibacter sp. CPCC 206217 TaxID=3064574 RepID=UPI00351C4D7B